MQIKRTAGFPILKFPWKFLKGISKSKKEYNAMHAENFLLKTHWEHQSIDYFLDFDRNSIIWWVKGWTW